MIPEPAFARLLGLDDGWAVSAAEFETEPVERFFLVLPETPKLWPKLPCPRAACGQQRVIGHEPTETRVWRHLDAFGKRPEILCAPPRARGCACRHLWRVPLPWAGQGKHFTRDCAAFARPLLRERPMKKAGDILGGTDPRLWRMLFKQVAKEGRAARHKTLYLDHKKPEHLSESEQARLDELDRKHLATGQAYIMRLEVRDIYQHTLKPERARDRLTSWVNWVRAKCERLGESLGALAKVADTVERHLEGSLAHWTSGWLSTGYLEGLHSVFSALKRKARGYRSCA